MRTANLPLYVDHMFAGMVGGMFMASHSYNEKNICSRCGVSEKAATYFGWDVSPAIYSLQLSLYV